ncbi:MAG TPA: hypothetical protein VFP47_20235 [Pyrinomonadaceae bacterium]|nr:hypothetical protein [Pyrinomonadaceae bacterium]
MAILPELIVKLEEFGELRVVTRTREKLLQKQTSLTLKPLNMRNECAWGRREKSPKPIVIG